MKAKYIRKTRDEFQIHQNFGDGWEEVSCYETRKEAKQEMKEYRENQPYPVKMIKRRFPIASC